MSSNTMKKTEKKETNCIHKGINKNMFGHKVSLNGENNSKTNIHQKG